MPDEASTPPDSTSSPQAADTQAPLSEPVSAPVTEPLQSADAAGQATPPPEAAAPASEPTPTETSAPAEVSEAVPEPEQPQTSEPQAQPEPVQQSSPSPQATQSVAPASASIIGELLVKARAKIQDRRKKKLERIMTKLSETGKISNDEVQKLLRVSDATATRYLDLLEKEGRLRQEGKTGKYVVYVRV